MMLSSDSRTSAAPQTPMSAEESTEEEIEEPPKRRVRRKKTDIEQTIEESDYESERTIKTLFIQ